MLVGVVTGNVNRLIELKISFYKYYKYITINQDKNTYISFTARFSATGL